MRAKFDIQIDLNGWVIPFHIERRGNRIFKIAYGNTALGHLLLNENSKWDYFAAYSGSKLMNLCTRNKIGKAIINY